MLESRLDPDYVAVMTLPLRILYFEDLSVGMTALGGQARYRHGAAGSRRSLVSWAFIPYLLSV
jgi:hypothetical protein